MELQNTIKANGELTIEVRDENGNVKEIRHAKNLVVSVGKTFIASRVVGTSSGVMSYMAIGISTQTPAACDTALISEAGRVALASGTNSANAITYTATFPAGTGTGAITEAGILNGSSSGTLLCRTTFPVVNKAAGDSIAITWTITVS